MRKTKKQKERELKTKAIKKSLIYVFAITLVLVATLLISNQKCSN